MSKSIFTPILFAVSVVALLGVSGCGTTSVPQNTGQGTEKTTDNQDVTRANDCIDPAKISKRPCPQVYKPVCGCDEKTYPNACAAEVAGLTSYEEGACKDTADTSCVDPALRKPDGVCTMVYEPVCGCNGKTYSNECKAKIDGVKKWNPGICDEQKAKTDCIDPSKISSKGCPENWDPVCGCDNKTYGNACEAESAGVLFYVKGECKKKSDCIDDSKINPEGVCPMVYDPVCGCDGKTYSNECKAIINGVTKWEKGACDE